MIGDRFDPQRPAIRPAPPHAVTAGGVEVDALLEHLVDGAIEHRHPPLTIDTRTGRTRSHTARRTSMRCHVDDPADNASTTDSTVTAGSGTAGARRR